MPAREPIAIIGAGLGGLSCALALQRLGFEARVFEQSPELGEVGAGIGLWRGAVLALEQLQVPEWFWLLRTCPFRRAETATPDGRVVVGFDVAAMTADAPGFVVRRADLHRALAEQVGTITTGARLTGLRQDPDGVTLAFADGRSVRADLVVGADGLRSVVRAALFGDSPPRYSGETCYRGLADLAVADTGMLREVQGAGLRCAVHPLDPGHVYWWAARRAPRDLVESPVQRKEMVRRLFDGWEFGFPAALAATPADSILKNDLYDRPALRRWSAGRVTLLGDAAHPTTPNLGLGGCMAIEDGLVLARALAEHGGAHEAAFGQYQRERSRRTRRVVRTSAQFGRLGSMTHPLAIRTREAAYRLAPTRLTARMFRREVAYDAGPLRRG